MKLVKLILFSLVLSVPIILSHYMDFLIIGVIVYPIGLYLDVRSTISKGITQVRKYETSPIFRYSTKYGFKIAIISQIAFETSLVILLPLIILYELNYSLSGGFLVSFGIIHMVGYYLNTKTSNSIN